MPELGIRPEGFSPFTASYVRFGKQILSGVPDTDHVMYDRGVRVHWEPRHVGGRPRGGDRLAERDDYSFGPREVQDRHDGDLRGHGPRRGR